MGLKHAMHAQWTGFNRWLARTLLMLPLEFFSFHACASFTHVGCLQALVVAGSCGQAELPRYKHLLSPISCRHACPAQDGQAAKSPHTAQLTKHCSKADDGSPARAVDVYSNLLI